MPRDMVTPSHSFRDGITVWRTDDPDDFSSAGRLGQRRVAVVVQVERPESAAALVVADGILGWCIVEHVMRVTGA